MTRAAVLRGHSLSMPIESVSLDAPRDDEILVRIVACGVCHTDLKVAQVDGLSPRPIVLGHEGAGIVERVGRSVTRLAPGDHVLLTFDSCGCCSPCQSSKPSYCVEGGSRSFSGRRPDRSVTLSANGEPIHGSFFGQSSFATHALANERNAVKVDRSLPLHVLAPLGCGIQTGAGAVLNSLGMGAGMTIAIFGVGAVGLAAVMAARIASASRVFAIDTRPERLELARQLGATDAIDAGRENALDVICRSTGTGVDRSLDTTASDSAIDQAVECLAPLGTCGLIANRGPTHRMSMNILSSMLKGRSVRGIAQGDSVPALFIPKMIDFWRKGLLPLERLVGFYPFDEIDSVLAAAHAGAVIKPVLRMA